MRDWSINIDKIPLISVINCEISRKVNEHAYAVIEGYIEGDNEEDYIRLSTSNTYVSIYAKDRYEKVPDIFYEGCIRRRSCSLYCE